MNIRDAMLNANKGIFPKRVLQETETSGAVASAAPEHVIDIAYNGEEKQLTESLMGLQESGPWYTESMVRDDFESGEIDFDKAMEVLQKRFGVHPSYAKQYLGYPDDDFEDEYEEEDPLDRLDDANLYNLDERIKLRKYFNKKLTEAIKENKIEDITNEEKPLGKIRYKLQKFTNGGTPYVDESGTAKKDGESGGPSQYEQWRYEMNDKKRKARLEQERDDANSQYHSPRLTQPDPENTLDNQVDAFLAKFVKDNENQDS